MVMFCVNQAKSKHELITTYSPIARSVLSMAINPAVREKFKKKFGISFVFAKEHIHFLKYPAIHDLEEKHRVDPGAAYKNQDSARNFVHYIAESQRRCLHTALGSSNFYSILVDSFTDKGRVENKLFAMLFCQKDDLLLEFKTTARYYLVCWSQERLMRVCERERERERERV